MTAIKDFFFKRFIRKKVIAGVYNGNPAIENPHTWLCKAYHQNHAETNRYSQS
jgi:hypothetical protein